MYNTHEMSSTELWAIVNEKEEVMWSFGGSSVNPKLLVYSSERKTKGRLTSLKRIYEKLGIVAHIKLVYSAKL